jgi:hypothetical protein
MRLRQSLQLLGAVISIALIGLAMDGNWPKVGRVGAAAGVYALTLLALARRDGPPDPIEWWRFAAAGMAAGLVSGLLRPERGDMTTVIDAGAALVLASVHWSSLALSERVRRKIVA